MLLADVTSLSSASARSPGTTRVAVIGSGAVGLFAANELAKRGIETVVIEAGDRHLGSFDSRSFESIGMRNDGIRIGRSRSLGGTTNLWGGQLVEFQPIDFVGRDWMPGSAWPVSYEEIVPYYRSTYNIFGIDGEKQDDDAVWKSVSAQRPDLGSDFEAFLTRWLKSPNFATVYDAQIQTDKRLLVLTGHTAVGFRGDVGGKIEAVRVRDNAGNEHAIEADTFILAAGTIENSRLLLHAQADAQRPCPWRGNRHVGRYFQDHIAANVATVQPNDKRVFFDTFCTIAKSGNKYQPKFRMRNATLQKKPILNMAGFLAFESSASEHLVYLKQFLKAALYSRKLSGIGDVLRNARGTAKYLAPLMWRYAWDHRIFVPSTSKITLVVQSEQFPVAESQIRIDPAAKDAYGLPRAILDWQLADGGRHEIDSIHEFTKCADEALNAAGLAKLRIDDDLLNKRPDYIKTFRDTLHQSGGTLMGNSDADGVVDKNLLVFGTANLYVGGSSTFRTVGNANTTLTAMAFAARLVDHLAGSSK